MESQNLNGYFSLLDVIEACMGKDHTGKVSTEGTDTQR